MAGADLEMFLRHVRRVLRPSPTEAVSDAQLLSRFVQQRDEEAFELLVWRHGLMVLNVCRRVLRHEHDAEDAFQATFLALARKANSIGKRESLGSWLYKVAYRVALRAAQSMPLRSLTDEPPDCSSREPIKDLLCCELGAAIDEEIRRLPEKYRAALVLCHLEGHTIESASGILACPPGTIGTWLARAKLAASSSRAPGFRSFRRNAGGNHRRRVVGGAGEFDRASCRAGHGGAGCGCGADLRIRRRSDERNLANHVLH